MVDCTNCGIRFRPPPENVTQQTTIRYIATVELDVDATDEIRAAEAANRIVIDLVADPKVNVQGAIVRRID